MKNQLYRILLSVVFLSWAMSSVAQLNPSPSQFFHNQMVQTVAATGVKDMTRFDMSFRNTLLNTFYGAPVNMYATFQTQLKNGGGVGLQFNGDNAGLLSRSRVMGSYALDLSKGATRIRLGIGLGMMMNRVNSKNGTLIRGDINDPALAEFNQQGAMVDGSIGFMMEKENGLQVLANIPSLGSIQQFSKYASINYTVFNTMVKKRFNLGVSGDEYIKGMSTIEPLIGFRMIHGGGDVIDMGAMFKYQEWIGFTAMYHTNSEYSFGVHIPYKDRMALNFTFNSGKVYSKNYFNVGGTLEGHVLINLK
ncbi:MAG: type IX secretion system membrane protein PorP/SprF [Sphingobacteriales bacterium]